MLNPKLRGKAIAVCGATEERHGIVLAKSELAKKAGVKTGMVNWEAKQRCPGLILVPPQYEQYLKYSKLAHEIYYRYTDQVEPFGMDECWLDVTGSNVFGSGMEIAEEIRQAVKDELGLTVSIGVSFNKIFAKLGSDMKKPDAITEITPGNYREKVWPLPASELLYVGPATARKLSKHCVHTIGDMAEAGPANLEQWFGVNGLKLWRYASGTDISRVMQKDFVSPIKSIGHGITCTADLETSEEVYKVMLELSQDVGHRLRIHELACTGVQIWIRSNDLSGSQFQCKLPYKTQVPIEIARAGFQLFQAHYQWHIPVRAVTISIGCSMRIGEILGLTWSNVIFHEDGSGTIRITQTLKRCDKKTLEDIAATKGSEIFFRFPQQIARECKTVLTLKSLKTTSSNRSVAIPSTVIKELLQHRELQNTRKEELHGAYEDYDLVIALDNGMPMEERMVAKAFKSFIKENDLPEVVFHSLRHLSTSLKLVASNGDIKAVQGDTGHAQARMVTEVYAHTFDGNRREIANKLDHLFFSSSADGKGEEKTDLKEKLLLAVTKRPELLQVLTALTEE